ncbi:MAG: hypothetical protein ACTHJL_09250, partial [Amnibacterium sp.]
MHGAGVDVVTAAGLDAALAAPMRRGPAAACVTSPDPATSGSPTWSAASRAEGNPVRPLEVRLPGTYWRAFASGVLRGGASVDRGAVPFEAWLRARTAERSGEARRPRVDRGDLRLAGEHL